MIVYVETNFLLELAYLQERCDSCEAIVELARVNAISLALPAISAAEARATRHRRTADRRTFQFELQKHIRQISRSRSFRDLDEKAIDVLDAFLAGAKEAETRLEAAIAMIETHGFAIPLTSEILILGRLYETLYGLTPQDALVVGSVQWHAETDTSPKCFVSQDMKAFSDDAIYKELSKGNCRVLTNFDDALGYINSSLRRAGN